ncbi:MAG: hypothetical protein B6D64_12815 [Bacteroidetes bacterium 4484_276]|nr:MAG: hypothetical protein B6D64_12815 [Bacteroidetes bacterium 4484_276]
MGGPHAVSKVENPTNEFLQSAPPQNVTYTPFDKVNTIKQSTSNRLMTFTYGPQNSRKITKLYQTDDADENILLQTKYFVGGSYEIEEDAEGNQRKLHYLSAGTGLSIHTDLLRFVRTSFAIFVG